MVYPGMDDLQQLLVIYVAVDLGPGGGGGGKECWFFFFCFNGPSFGLRPSK